MRISNKVRVFLFKRLPQPWINKILLAFPSLYGTNIVSYESNLLPELRELIIEGIKKTTEENVSGDIIECGCARGGTTVMMSKFLKKMGSNKHVYALDSFGGFEPTELQREHQQGLTLVSENAFTKNSYSYVQQKMKALSCNNVTLVPGFFQDTIDDVVRNKRFSFAFIDCDLKDSMLLCLNRIWPKLSSGGIICCDDYMRPEFAGVKMALDIFLAEKELEILEHGRKASMGQLYYIVKK